MVHWTLVSSVAEHRRTVNMGPCREPLDPRRTAALSPSEGLLRLLVSSGSSFRLREGEADGDGVPAPDVSTLSPAGLFTVRLGELSIRV